jgi:hypothetical protein
VISRAILKWFCIIDTFFAIFAAQLLRTCW